MADKKAIATAGIALIVGFMISLGVDVSVDRSRLEVPQLPTAWGHWWRINLPPVHQSMDYHGWQPTEAEIEMRGSSPRD